MKSSKKKIIILAVIFATVILAVALFFIYRKSNHLTMEEKKYLTNASATASLINVNVINNLDVFASDGAGVFYDFLNDFSETYSLNLNKITFDYGKNVSGIFLGATTSPLETDEVIYKDHYVIVSKDFKNIPSLDSLKDAKIGILNDDLSYVSGYINNSSLTFTTYGDSTILFNSFDQNEYIIVPLHLYLEKILTSNYSIVYHLSDINLYYVLRPSNDNLGSILIKYYKNWKSNFKESYNENLFSLMVDSLYLSDTSIEEMQNKTYKYGFVNNSPYEVISSGNYGGIAAVYLDGFISLTNLDFKFTKYKNINKFNKALADGDIDIYFNYYNIASDFYKANDGISAKYYVIANNKNDIVINSINTLKGQDVYVDKNSYLYTYLQNINGVNVKTYDKTSQLLKLNNKDAIILIDSNIFKYYVNHGLSNYDIRYENYLDQIYTFSAKEDSAMYKLLNRYINIMDSNTVLNDGLYNHEKTVHTGIILSYVAKYFMYILAVGAIVLYFLIRKTKKIKIAKKIKRDDKLKFIDQLTLLKNRNYLSENIASWSKNTIYPQAILVIDLNYVRHINDIEGYSQGDKQIKAAANALIKTQLDNSEIIRTDGNEFVIYMVGYSQKQVTNYIHKIMKEFGKLPYNYGAEFGYSMILDDIKTIEDALNEATKTLKEKKENNENDKKSL